MPIRMQTDFDGPTCRRVVECIRQVVCDHLHETVGIGKDGHVYAGRGFQVNGSCRYYLTLVFDRLLDNADQITGLHQQLQRLSLDTRGIQEVVDQAVLDADLAPGPLQQCMDRSKSSNLVGEERLW